MVVTFVYLELMIQCLLDLQGDYVESACQITPWLEQVVFFVNLQLQCN